MFNTTEVKNWGLTFKAFSNPVALKVIELQHPPKQLLNGPSDKIVNGRNIKIVLCVWYKTVAVFLNEY